MPFSHLELLASENVRVLLDVSLKSAALLAVAAIVCGFLRQGSAAVRHRVWTLAILASLLLPIAVLFLPRLRMPILPSGILPTSEPAVVDNAAAGPAVEAETETGRPTPRPLIPPGLEKATPRETVELQSAPTELPSEIGVEQAVVSHAPIGATPRRPTVGARSVLFGIWILGVLAVGVPLLGLRLIQWLRHRRETPIHDPAWNACVKECAERLGVSRNIKSFTTKRGTVPAVYGVLRPYLVVPENYHEWSEELRRCVLLHELAHVKRRDVATQFLGRLTAAIYWFNPLAWHALKRLRIERELASDDCVLLAGQRPSDYAQQLLNMLRMYRVERLALGVAMSHTARLDQRVLAVLDQNRCRFPVTLTWARLSGITAVLLAGLLGAVSIATPSATASDTPGEETVAKDAAEPKDQSPNQGDDSATVMRFTGQVLQGKKPVPGATITLWQRIGPEGFYENWHPREELDVKPRQVAVSDENGRFEFTFSTKEMKDTPWNLWNNWIKPWHQVQVVVSKEGLGVGWCNLEQLRKRQKMWIRGTVPLLGKVIDLQGQPVGGCRVRFFSLRDGLPDHVVLWQPTWKGLSQDVVTDADGRFVMNGLPANRKGIRLYVSGPSVATKIFSVNVGGKEGPPVEVIVEPTKPIEGIVRDRETGEPISGVVVYGAEDKSHRLVRSVTNESGEYRLVGLPKSKRHWVTTYSPFSKGYLTRYTSAVDTPGLAAIKHDIQLRRGIPVHLTVIDKRTRERLHPEVHYTPTRDNPLHREAKREDYYPGDEYRRMHAADENGVVRFVAYPGRGLVDVLLQGAVYLPVGNTKEVVENSKVDPLTFGFSALSAAHGVIHPKPGDEVFDVELVADAGEQLTARLIDEDGKPVAGATAANRYFNDYSSQFDVFRNDDLTPGYASGLGELLKESSFTVFLLEPDKPRLLVFLHQEKKLIGLATAAAGEKLADVVMKRWGTVKGIVTDPDGKPLAGVEVKVEYPKRPAQGNWPKQPSAKTDAEGRFTIERLIPGRNHKLTVETRKGLAADEVSEIKPDSGETVDAGEIRLSKNSAKK